MSLNTIFALDIVSRVLKDDDLDIDLIHVSKVLRNTIRSELPVICPDLWIPPVNSVYTWSGTLGPFHITVQDYDYIGGLCHHSIREMGSAFFEGTMIVALKKFAVSFSGRLWCQGVVPHSAVDQITAFYRKAIDTLLLTNFYTKHKLYIGNSFTGENSFVLSKTQYDEPEVSIEFTVLGGRASNEWHQVKYSIQFAFNQDERLHGVPLVNYLFS